MTPSPAKTLRRIRYRIGNVLWLLFAICMFALSAVALALCFFRWQADQREIGIATQLAPSSGKFVHAADVNIFIQESGPTTGPAVLFVHGTGAWSETWREAMTVLAHAGFYAIAIDLPPFGYSRRPAQSNYNKQDQGKRIIGVLDALKIDRAVLVGHSFGGGPTVEATFAAPERVRALVLVDAALSIHNDGATAKEPSPLLNGFFATTALRDSVVATFLTSPLFTKQLLKSFIADPVHATDARVRVYQQPLVVKGTTHAFGEWLPALLGSSPNAVSEDPTAYRGLAMPVYIIWGNLDTITPLVQGERLARLTPRSELTVLQGVGHIPQIEDPAHFNEALLRVLLKIKSEL